jgi:hypothetical protein
VNRTVRSKDVHLSIVSTFYNSAPYLEEFHRRTMAAAEQVLADIWLMARTGRVDLPLTGVKQVPFEVATFPSLHRSNRAPAGSITDATDAAAAERGKSGQHGAGAE